VPQAESVKESSQSKDQEESEISDEESLDGRVSEREIIAAKEAEKAWLEKIEAE
jgi:hypothetical protein